MPKVLFQGDICFVEVDAIPTDATPMQATDGRHIVSHSETGHHHTIAAGACEAWQPPSDPNVCYLQMTTDCDVIHERAWDTHAPVALRAKKIYMGVRQVERSPEGWRRVAD